MSFEVGTRCWYPNSEAGWIGCEVTKNDFQDGTYHIELTSETGLVIPIETKHLESNNAMENNHEFLPVLRNPPILELSLIHI